MEFNNNKNNNNYFLPEEISINIISLLPTLSVLRCSLVCKSWRDFIICKIIWNNREFARMHLLRGGLESHHHHYHGASAYYTGRFNFLLQTNLGYHKGTQLYYTLDDDNDNDNYEENPEPRLRMLRSNPNPFDNKNYYVVGSCNGLICMVYAYMSNFEQPIYICNPITREWLTLPSLTINECSSSCSRNDNNDDPTSVSIYRKVVWGFGYLPSTDEYKVVRITYSKHEQYPKSSEGRVHVYTLGDGTGWRDKGEIISYELGYYPNMPSILANGALHWIDECEGKIVAFDLADEEFLFLPRPPCFIPDEYPCKIQVLGGQLCAFHPKECLTVSMWFFKNKKEEKKGGNYKEGNGWPECQSWSWIKEFDIERDLKTGGFFNPFILTEHGDVLYYSWKSLFCYDLKTATSKELVGMVKCLSSDFYRFEAIPHLNSFISLKALEEEDTKVIESPH